MAERSEERWPERVSGRLWEARVSLELQRVVGRNDDAKRVCVFIFRVKAEVCRVIYFLF